MSLFSKVSASAIAAAALFAAAPLAAQPPAEPDVMAEEPMVGTGSRITVIGAIKDSSTPAPAVREDERVPELPVVYEDDEG